MSDDAASQPARKVGSLRDRIAQFESKPAAPAPPPKPTVPKKTWAWKEKQTEQAAQPPPQSSAPSAPVESAASSSNIPDQDYHPESVHSDPAGSHAGFSAEDAKAAISAGGGLKARLAALQGSGLGAPVGSPPVPPPPSGKPRVWKKAVVTYEPPPSKPRYDQRDDEEHAESEEHEHHSQEVAAATDVPAAEEDSLEEPHDEAEEERQRRAAIAARMARLGGARVGMPMVFGKAPAPPPAPKREPEPEPEPEEAVPGPVVEKRHSVDEASSFRPESSATEVTETTDVTLESTEPETSTEDHYSVAVPSSPPRSRPPVPAPRSWSSSPPTSPKSVTRPEIGSQGSSFSVPRAVYDFPPSIYPVVARASGGISVADHLRNNRSPSPIISSPLSLSPLSASPTSYDSHPLPAPPSRMPGTTSHRRRPLSTRHSDSALRSSMVTDGNPRQYLNGQPGAFQPNDGHFGPTLFTTEGGPSNYISLNQSHTSPISSHPRYPASNMYPYSDAADNHDPRHADLTTPSRDVPGGQPVSRLSRRASSSSFYPRPLARSSTPPHLSSSKPPASVSSGRSSLRFRFFGWLKKRRLTEPSLPSSSSPPQLVAPSNITPAARIKSKYQLATGMVPTSTSMPPPTRTRSDSLDSMALSLRRTPPPPPDHGYGSDVVLMNSPVDENPPPLPPKKIPPPRPSRPYSPSSSRSESPSGDPRRLQRANVLRASPVPFSQRKPSFGSDAASMTSGLSRSGSVRSNASAPGHYAQIHTLMPHHPSASASLKHSRGDLAFPLTMPVTHSVDDVQGEGESLEESKENHGDLVRPEAKREAATQDVEPEVVDAAAVPLPPSRKPTDLPPPAVSSSSPPLRVPLPAMPKRAAPPRRKMPTPKPSSDAVPKVESPAPEPSAEVSQSAVDEIPSATTAPPEDNIAVSEVVEKDEPAVGDDLDLPKDTPEKTGAAAYEDLSPPEARTPSPEPDDQLPVVVAATETPGEHNEEHAKGDEIEHPQEPSTAAAEKPKDSLTESDRGKSGDSSARPVPARKSSQKANKQDSLSRAPPPPPRGLHEASPRPSLDQQGSTPRMIASANLVEEPNDAEAGQQDEEAERKSRIAERMAKMGGVGMFGAPSPARPSPTRKQSTPATDDQSPSARPIPARTSSSDSRGPSVEIEVPMSPSRHPPPKRKSLPPPPLPITTKEGQSRSATGAQKIPLSARPGRTSVGPPARLPPPPPTAPVLGSFAAESPKAAPAALRIVPPSPEATRTKTEDTDSYRSPGELMLDADTDPIDPTFYSPLRSPAKLPSESEEEPQLPEIQEQEQSESELPWAEAQEPVETPEQTRKKTLAERMAKLGGISFATPPGVSPLGRRPPPGPASREASEAEKQENVQEELRGDDDDDEESEEASRARRAAIAARLAAGGGMRLGMLPGSQKAAPAVVHSAEPSAADDEHAQKGEVEQEETAEEEQEQEDPSELPPPPPHMHRPAVPPAINTSTPPPLPPGRHSRPASALPATPNARTPMSPPPKPSRLPPTPIVHHSSVPTDEESNHPLPPIPPPPPPPLPQHYPPVTYEIAPPPVVPAATSGQWGLPDIPSSSLMSDEGQHRTQQHQAEGYDQGDEDEQPPSGPPKLRAPLTVQELTALWNRVGLQVITAAKMLVEQSKNTIIGDGSPGGFIETALSAVPSAQPIFPQDGYFGNLIYAQTGPSIIKRSADIMPGDIVALTDVKLKGFKGLQAYNLHIGTSGGPLLAIVAEFEGGKKQKLRVYQAALQANSYPSIETTSYRLDDLKSGTIQIFRVEEATR